ncbi:MAG: hypothetical protein JO327_01545 [Nitrososphaeraceae archaeon]|nr:hypothetical protein [Nitrososphaeraceae archaeon]
MTKHVIITNSRRTNQRSTLYEILDIRSYKSPIPTGLDHIYGMGYNNNNNNKLLNTFQ